MACLGVAVPASAAEIVGTIGFSGSITYDNRLVQATPLDSTDLECPSANPTCGASILDFADDIPVYGTAGTGAALTVFSQSGYFDGADGDAVPVELAGNGITGGTFARILDLTNDLFAAGIPGPAYAPAGGGHPVIAGFLDMFTDAQANGLHFDLTQVVFQGNTCTGSEGLGDSCFAGPFALQETAGGLRINFDVLGYFRDASGNEGFFTGGFGSTFTGLTFQEAFRRLDRSGEDLLCGPNNLTAPCSFELNFVNTAIPEPATLLTFGAGSALLAAVRRRRTAKQAAK
jgi:hypothetical protein